MIPRTWPRFNSKLTSETISCLAEPRPASTLRCSTDSRGPLLLSPAALFIIEPTRPLQKPVNHEVHAYGQQRDGEGRQQRRYIAVTDERRGFTDHRAPVGC